MANAIAKSIKHTKIEENGNMIFGKYTFVSRFAFANKLPLESLTQEAIKFQIITPAPTFKKFCDVLLVLSINLEIILNIKIFIKGLIMAQIIPIQVCLYLTVTSL